MSKLDLDSPIEVDISNDMYIEATDYVYTMHQAAVNNGCQSIMQYDMGNDIMGKVAELCFEEVLQQWQVKYEHRDVYGQADDFDFKINNQIIDVKSSTKFNLNIAHQHLKKSTGIYVFMHIDTTNNKAYFMGWIEAKRVKKHKLVEAKNPYVCIHWRKLNDPNDLLGVFD